MNIIKNRKDSTLTIAVEGRLDAITSRQLEAVLRTSLEGITELDFDLSKLEYLSSAGIRVLMSSWKVMKRRGRMVVSSVSPEVLEILEFADLTEIFGITDGKNASEK